MAPLTVLSLALCATTAAGTVYFEEKFADKSWEKRWCVNAGAVGSVAWRPPVL